MKLNNNKKGLCNVKVSDLHEEFNELAEILGERKTDKTRSPRLPSANHAVFAIKHKSCVHINFSISSDPSKRADSSLNESAAVVCEFVPPHSNIGGGI